MAWEPETIKRGPLPPKAPTEGLGWRDTDSRTLYVWAEGRGWVQASAYEPPQAAAVPPVAIEAEPAPVEPPKPEPAPVEAAQAPAAPSPAPPRPPAREPVPAAPPRERQETHPILARHAREIERGRPLDPRGNRSPRPRPEPEFSDEFKAQLARVAAGAGIVEVAPVRSHDPDGLIGSSLGFDV